jgi:hypothetical protein
MRIARSKGASFCLLFPGSSLEFFTSSYLAQALMRFVESLAVNLDLQVQVSWMCLFFHEAHG